MSDHSKDWKLPTYGDYMEPDARDTELASLRDENQALQKRVDELTGERDSARAQATDYASRYGSLAIERDQFRSDVLASQAENARLRGALEFYADTRTYFAGIAIAHDNLGGRARSALAEIPAPPIGEVLGKVRRALEFYAFDGRAWAENPRYSKAREALAALDSLGVRS